MSAIPRDFAPDQDGSFLDQAGWEQFWARPGENCPWLHEGPREQVQRALADGFLEPGRRVLDLGCGMGSTSAWLARQGFQVLGLDFSAAAIGLARRLHGGIPGLAFDVVDVSKPAPLEGRFGFLLDLGCLHSLPVGAKPGYARNLLAWTEAGSRVLLLMRYGAPWFEQASRESRSREVELLFSPEFTRIAMEASGMERTPCLERRPAVQFKFQRV